MYWFKEVEKANLLQGRTIKYLAEKKLFVNVSYLSQILNGRRGCSATLARLITNCISWEAKLEDYFVRKEK